MGHRIIYIAPREKRQRKKPFRQQPAYGAASLTAAIIGQAANDFICGNAEESNLARMFFMSDDYAYYRSLLGLPDDLLPEAIRDRVLVLED
jgi:hypothetical protein